MEINYPRKEKKVNKQSQEKCTENFAFILHENINSKLDLFPDKLHSSKKGQDILKENSKRKDPVFPERY